VPRTFRPRARAAAPLSFIDKQYRGAHQERQCDCRGLARIQRLLQRVVHAGALRAIGDDDPHRGAHRRDAGWLRRAFPCTPRFACVGGDYDRLCDVLVATQAVSVTRDPGAPGPHATGRRQGAPGGGHCAGTCRAGARPHKPARQVYGSSEVSRRARWEGRSQGGKCASRSGASARGLLWRKRWPRGLEVAARATDQSGVSMALRTRSSVFGVRALFGVWGVAVAGCGGAVSTDGRWEDDAELPLEPTDGGFSAPSEVESDCTAAWRTDVAARGYVYANPPGFWLGSQAPRALAVDGLGYLALGQAAGGPPARRYAREVTYSIAPDGSLQNDAGRRLLGYLPNTEAVGGDCLAALRVPVSSPPYATAHIQIQMNFDARQSVKIFDIYDPPATSNGSTSMTVFDSLGGGHTLDLYFNNMGGGLYAINVVVDGVDLAGGTPGIATLLASGALQFTTDGALEAEALPPLDVTFAGATPNQQILVDFGDAIVDGGYGLNGSTSFASDMSVFAQSQDGLPAGIGADAVIDGWGIVHAEFDSGATLEVGRLALARFPREARLFTDSEGLQRETVESGAPLLGRPLDPGRGSLHGE
jgi:flagellar hook-basal body protein